MSPSDRVAIVGAGLAGLTAARELASQCSAVEIFEGRDRIGGRVLPVPPGTWPLSVELGAEFIHAGAPPTLSLLAALHVPLDPVGDQHLRHVRSGFSRMGDAWRRLARLFDDVDTEAEASAGDFLRREGLPPSDAELLRLLVEGFDAASLDEVSLQSVVAEVRALADHPRQFRPHDGYGAVLQKLSLELSPSLVRIHLGSVVDEIRWSDGGCTLSVRHRGNEHERVTAGRCIVTAPIGVLQAREGKAHIRFEPELPANDFPVTLLGMGHAVKIVLGFRDAPFLSRGRPGADFLHFPGEPFQTAWVERNGDAQQVTLWAGGPNARHVECFDSRDLTDVAVGQLAAAFSIAAADVRESLVAAHHHDFSRDPFSLGAYPFARPGGSKCAFDLARPLGDRLFFAGDATDAAYFGTAAGAIASGKRAAQAILSMTG